MQIRGQVLSVRPWDFKSQSNERIQMLSLEVYDDTAGLVRGEMRDSGFQPARKNDIVATVTGIKKARFGDGFVMTFKDVQPMAGDSTLVGQGSPASFAPPASKPETAATPAVGKK